MKKSVINLTQSGKSCGNVPESLRNMKEYSGKTERNSPDRPPLPTELV